MIVANLSKSVDVSFEGMNVSSVSDTLLSTAGCYMTTVTCLGIFENLLVICTLIRHRELLNSNNTLILFLALSDLLMSGLSFPFIAASSIARRWLFSEAGCQWYALSMTVFGCASINLLACIALERYIVIVIKKRELSRLSKIRAFKFVTCCYAMGLVIGVCPMFGWGVYGLEPGFPSCSPAWWHRSLNSFTFNVAIFAFAFFMPMCLLCFSYLRIFVKVRVNLKKRYSSRVSSEVRVALLGLVMIVFFLLSWGPYALVAFLKTFFGFISFPDILNVLPVMMAKSSVLWNPIIYLSRNKKFRQTAIEDVKKLVSCFDPQKQKDSPIKEAIQQEGAQPCLRRDEREQVRSMLDKVKLPSSKIAIDEKITMYETSV